MRANFLSMVLASLLLVIGVGQAQAIPTTIDFEELSYGQSVAYDQYADQGIIFDSGIDWKIYELTNYPKALLNNTNFGGNLLGEFVNAVSSLSIYLGDVGGDFDTATLNVYDTYGNLLGSDYGEGNSWFSVQVDTNSIFSFEVVQSGLIVYDEITFDTAPVPEPATMLLFGAGLAGLAGTQIRRKKK